MPVSVRVARFVLNRPTETQTPPAGGNRPASGALDAPRRKSFAEVMMASPIRTILCPVDFSPEAEEAVRYAVSLGERIGASEVKLLHVHQPVAHIFPESAVVFDSEVLSDARGRMARQLEDLAKRYGSHGVDISTRLVDGIPYAAIVEHAQEIGSDLIVMGTHGRTGIAHFLLGSTAERVVRASRIPVCTVRLPE